jgi:hypothetical protein
VVPGACKENVRLVGESVAVSEADNKLRLGKPASTPRMRACPRYARTRGMKFLFTRKFRWQKADASRW